MGNAGFVYLQVFFIIVTILQWSLTYKCTYFVDLPMEPVFFVIVFLFFPLCFVLSLGVIILFSSSASYFICKAYFPYFTIFLYPISPIARGFFADV